MNYRGRIKDCVAVPDTPVELPQDKRAKVQVLANDGIVLDSDLAKLVGILPADINAEEVFLRAVLEKHS